VQHSRSLDEPEIDEPCAATRLCAAGGRLSQAKEIGEAIGRLEERYACFARFYAIGHAEKAKNVAYERLRKQY